MSLRIISVSVKYIPLELPNMLYQCRVCGYVYDESEGCPWHGIPPTRFEDLKDFRCPICGNKEFERL